MKRNFSVVARYPLKFTRCSLLVLKSLVSLQNLLVTRCRSCSLQKITCYSFQKNHSLLDTNFARYSLQKITRYSFQNLLVIRCRSCSLQNSLVPRCRSGVTFCKFIKVTPAQMLCYEFLMQNFKITYCVKHLRTTSSENNIKTSTNIYSFYLMSINLFTSI